MRRQLLVAVLCLFTVFSTTAKTSEHRGVYRPFNHYKPREVADNYNELKLAIQDGINAHQLAIDHRVIEQTVTKDSVIDIKMVDEGGFDCRIEPMK